MMNSPSAANNPYVILAVTCLLSQLYEVKYKYTVKLFGISEERKLGQTRTVGEHLA